MSSPSRSYLEVARRARVGFGIFQQGLLVPEMTNAIRSGRSADAGVPLNRRQTFAQDLAGMLPVKS